MTRDQKRAQYAYGRVDAMEDCSADEREEYSRAVKELGPIIMRTGLAGAMAALERRKARLAIGMLLDDLGRAGVIGVGEVGAGDLPQRVRGLEVQAYMLATRDILKVVLWLKRAVQAAGW